MAAQVLSGTGNVSYTNSTGQNVRIVINYLSTNNNTCTMTFQGVTITLPNHSQIGKSLAWEATSGAAGERGYYNSNLTGNSNATPTEIAMSNGETFALDFDGGNGPYNIIIIPEAG